MSERVAKWPKAVTPECRKRVLNFIRVYAPIAASSFVIFLLCYLHRSLHANELGLLVLTWLITYGVIYFIGRFVIWLYDDFFAGKYEARNSSSSCPNPVDPVNSVIPSKIQPQSNPVNLVNPV